MKWRLWFLICLQTIATGGSVISVAEDSSDPPHLTLARQLLAQVKPEHNIYTARPTKIVWPDEATNAEPVRNHSVCSSFGAALLRKAYQVTKQDLIRLFDEVWPEADEMFSGMTRHSEFEQVALVGQVKPGDFFMLDYRSAKKIPTGHVMLISGTPQRIVTHRSTNIPFKFATKAQSRSIPEKIVEWHVKVIDSSKSPHGKGDSRSRSGPDGKDQNGLGEGLVRLLTDQSGKPIGYTWSTSRWSRLWLVGDRPIAIGRWVTFK